MPKILYIAAVLALTLLTLAEGFVNLALPGGSWCTPSCRSCRSSRAAPMRLGFRSEGPKGRPGNKMTLEVEDIVDGGMHAQEALSRGRRFEALHLALAPSHHLV